MKAKRCEACGHKELHHAFGKHTECNVKDCDCKAYTEDGPCFSDGTPTYVYENLGANNGLDR